MASEGWKNVFQSLQRSNSMLEELNLFLTNLHYEEAIYLTNFLLSNKSLISLKFTSNGKITIVGWYRLAAVLKSLQSVLENIDLSECNIDDKSFTCLANAPANNSMLQSLSLRFNIKTTIAGWRTFSSSVLQNPYSSLEKLDIQRLPVTGQTMTAFANDLANNSTIRELLISNLRNEEPDFAHVWESFSRIVCNTTSIMDTYQSNHTLQNRCQGERDKREFRMTRGLRLIITIITHGSIFLHIVKMTNT